MRYTIVLAIDKTQKPRSARIYPEIVDNNGLSHCDPVGVADSFASFFEEVYTPLLDVDFDPEFKIDIEEQYDIFKLQSAASPDELPGGMISADDVEKVIKKLKLRKAPGEDGITNEHIKHSGPKTVSCLVKLFNAVVTIGKVPASWKRGLIVPLYKGTGKPKQSCNSYRPVALLPCFLKIFENIVLSRISENCLVDISFPNKQQQGFQPELGCLTASFVLHETVYHNLELGSNTYVGFLDTSKAFDTVWRKGLLYKLYKLGITGRAWTLIDDCHIDTKSSIVVNQVQSRWFDVQQGVRQGGVLSTFFVPCLY